ncbi:hypothetical protein AVEN_49054-1 [Araneus ventricosus]|uniref:Uncharacterized protein n=1 Tax=Araneus ventricosus TaxID=182803 RepID=A0A4Y2HW57_ARAVE|nr:hypothetical protein AVEN_49054-1 [Araneus ventricosus]
MRRTSPELVPPSLTSAPRRTAPHHTTPAGGRLASTYDLACNMPIPPDLQWNRVSNLEPSGPAVDTFVQHLNGTLTKLLHVLRIRIQNYRYV